jgi:hypothetical protein
MARSVNAQIAVDLYKKLSKQYGYTPVTAWKGIARLLLTCDVWVGKWKKFHGVVVYRESNDLRLSRTGNPNACLKRAGELTRYLANELGIAPEALCGEIGLYWRERTVKRDQPHNLVGHAFRSIVATILEEFGGPELSVEEEVSPHKLFPGYEFHTRSKNPKIDVVVKKGDKAVALLSTRWRFRHDRVDVIDEALAYSSAAHRQNCRIYAVVGEFAPNRLYKILSHCPPEHPHPAIAAAVHFAPRLVTEGLGENGRVAHLRGLDWLIDESAKW